MIFYEYMENDDDDNDENINNHIEIYWENMMTY